MHISPLTATHAMAYKALMLHAYEQAADSFTSTPQERAMEPDSWWRGRIDLLLGDAYALAPRGEMEIKGKGAMPVYLLQPAS